MTTDAEKQDGQIKQRRERLNKDLERLKADPKKYAAIFREANSRAIYAHITTLLEHSRDPDDPVAGLAYIAVTESGKAWWSFAGQTDPVSMLGLLECLKLRLHNTFNMRNPERFGFGKDNALGDTLVIDDDGEAAIKCQGVDETEADREKAENGHFLLRELIGVARDFFGAEYKGDIWPMLDFLDAQATKELERLKPKAFYGEGDDA